MQKAEDLLGAGRQGAWHRVGTKAPRLRPAPGLGMKHHCGELGAENLEELMWGAQSWVALPPSFTQ